MQPRAKTALTLISNASSIGLHLIRLVSERLTCFCTKVCWPWNEGLAFLGLTLVAFGCILFVGCFRRSHLCCYLTPVRRGMCKRSFGSLRARPCELCEIIHDFEGQNRAYTCTHRLFDLTASGVICERKK